MIPFKDNVPSRRFPVITVVLILANVAAFLYEMSLSSAVLDDFFYSYGIVPYRLQVSGQSLIPLFAYDLQPYGHTFAREAARDTGGRLLAYIESDAKGGEPPGPVYISTGDCLGRLTHGEGDSTGAGR